MQFYNIQIRIIAWIIVTVAFFWLLSSFFRQGAFVFAPAHSWNFMPTLTYNTINKGGINFGATHLEDCFFRSDIEKGKKNELKSREDLSWLELAIVKQISRLEKGKFRFSLEGLKGKVKRCQKFFPIADIFEKYYLDIKLDNSSVLSKIVPELSYRLMNDSRRSSDVSFLHYSWAALHFKYPVLRERDGFHSEWKIMTDKVRIDNHSQLDIAFCSRFYARSLLAKIPYDSQASLSQIAIFQDKIRSFLRGKGGTHVTIRSDG